MGIRRGSGYRGKEENGEDDKIKTIKVQDIYIYQFLKMNVTVVCHKYVPIKGKERVIVGW